MTPIEKNIHVVDEQGNQYEATYPKRAKGLVKHGRARFISEDTICLACPPKYDLEDNKMSEQKNIQKVETVVVEAKPELSMPYLLEQIAKMQSDLSYLHEAFDNLTQIQNGTGAGGAGALAKAQAFADIVRCRETTNQQLLKLYEKMYDDLQMSSSLKGKAMDLLTEIAGNTDMSQEEKEMILGKIDDIRHISN